MLNAAFLTAGKWLNLLSCNVNGRLAQLELDECVNLLGQYDKLCVSVKLNANFPSQYPDSIQ